MSSDDYHWRAQMTPTARSISTWAVFATTSFNFGLPINFVSHYCYGRALYAVFYRRVFLKKNRAELFDCGVSNDMSKVTHLLVCIALTQCFCFASSVCFGSFKNLILSGFVRNWRCFPSRRLLYTSICLSIFFFLRSMFAFILLFVDFVRNLTFWHDMLQIYWCARKKSVDYFPGWGTPIWNRRGCSSEILNLTPNGDYLGMAQAFCDP